MKRTLFFLVIILFGAGQASAQYFGKNKPRYQYFDFKVLQTPHFEIYHYVKDKETLDRFAQWAEQWYSLHENIFKDTFNLKNPIILYSNHADFQQTSAISGNIGVSTGGVTEGLRNRVVLPYSMSNQSTFHVLGHELVHAFQFHSLLGGDSTGLESLANLPLWIVEGLAEYMSKGRVDAHTAMWMRNAVINDDVPSLKEMSRNPKYFPYRYGQAFWSFVTGYYGDGIIKPLFVATAKFGIERSVPIVLGIALEDLSEMWQNNLKEYYQPYLSEKGKDTEGRKIFSEENFGNLNIAPSLSPNGRYMIFLSEKSIFSTDLYIHDFRTKDTRKIVSTARLGNTDHLHYLESAGTWSPDSKQFAFVVFEKGKNKLVIMDAEARKKLDEFYIKGVASFSNPTWSPDGKNIVVNGMIEGKADLFKVNVRNQQVERLTNNFYAEIQPVYSPDGKYIAFSTDRVSMQNGRNFAQWTFNLALLNTETNEINDLDVFDGANNLNPVWDENGNLFFLSDRDGFRNIYKYNIDSNTIHQLTQINTGVSGITPFTPAISLSERGQTLVYSHYNNESYDIYRARPENMLNILVDKDDLDHSPAILPPGEVEKNDIVNPALRNLDDMDLVSTDAFRDEKYKSKFKLDYIGGGGGVGIGTSSSFGTRTGLVGGVDMLFSDVLGNNKLFGTLALNGEIYDFGGQIAYLNSKNRIGWGGSISHVPFRYSTFKYNGLDTLFFEGGGGILVDNYEIQTIRIFRDQLSGFTQFAFNQNQRVEAGLGFSRYSSRSDIFNNYYDAFGQLRYQDREKGEKPFDGFNLYNVEAAYVGDNSTFGLTSPLQGYRFRIGAAKYVGEFSYHTFLVDLRKYFWLKPVNFSFRALHFARYGNDANNRNLGYYYIIDPTLVRGYNSYSEEQFDIYGISLERIQGSKIAVGNFEVRMPFTGPEKLALIKSGLLFTDLGAFFDAGIAWFENNQFGENGDEIKPKPLLSAGLSLRVNLFGAFILEPYYAKPLVKDAPWTFGLNFVPGW